MRAGEYSGDSGVHYVEADWNPLCPFGYGLTYTTFVCSDLQIEGGSLSACEVEEGGRRYACPSLLRTTGLLW